MTTETVLSTLRNTGVVLWLDGETLRYRAPKGALTDDLRQAIRACKADLMALLKERFEERAAIMEYCGGLSRQEAERHAWDIKQRNVRRAGFHRDQITQRVHPGAYAGGI